jgi:hypothetical protein
MDLVPDRACLLAVSRNGGLSSQTSAVLGPVLSLTAPVVWIFLFAAPGPEGCGARLRCVCRIQFWENGQKVYFWAALKIYP